MHVLDEAGLRAWAITAHRQLRDLRDQIDRLNVFPVADADTGTNMVATMSAATSELAHVPAGSGWPAAAASLCRGALVGARGNSGVILAQFLQGFADPAATNDRGLDSEHLRTALGRAQELAYRAVVHPVEGTMLTVARAAAAAAASASGSVGEICDAAVAAARDALRRTTDQLDELQRAGVVDAGGLGILVLLQALRAVLLPIAQSDDVSEFLAAEGTSEGQAGITCALGDAQGGDATGPAYEVMYVLHAPQAAIDTLRERLCDLGTSVAVVGLEGLWNVHVHVDDAGAAIAAGLAAGEPSRIRVSRLRPDPAHGSPARRAVVTIAYGAGVADLLRSAGSVVVEVGRARPTGRHVVEQVARLAADEIIIVPSDRRDRVAAEETAAAVRRHGGIAAVIPTRSVVQALAAVAVHDASVRFEDAVVAMTRAATATRYGGITVSRREALTSGGPCNPGDVLGLIEGDIVVVGSDQHHVARAVVHRLLATSGEIVTLVTGVDAEPDLGQRLSASLNREHPGLDVVHIHGGQVNWPLIVGVE